MGRGAEEEQEEEAGDRGEQGEGEGEGDNSGFDAALCVNRCAIGICIGSEEDAAEEEDAEEEEECGGSIGAEASAHRWCIHLSDSAKQRRARK